MAWPLGPKLVIALGAFILACGVGNAIRAILDNFGSTLKCKPKVTTWACWLARAGYLGRGLAMLPVGFFMVRAGWHERATEARGVGGALWALHAQTFGDVMLALVALLLVIYVYRREGRSTKARISLAVIRCAILAVAGPMPSVSISAGPDNVADGNGRSWPITVSEAHPVRRTSRAFHRSASVEISSRSPSRA